MTEAETSEIFNVPVAVASTEDQERATDGPMKDAQSFKGFGLDPKDSDLLDEFFGPSIRISILNLYQKFLQKPNAKPASFGFVFSDPIRDRQKRTLIHSVKILQFIYLHG